MRIPLTLKGAIALAVWAVLAVCALRADPGSLVPEQRVPIHKIKAIVIESDGIDSRQQHYRYIDSKDDEIAKLKATIESLNRDIADLKKLQASTAVAVRPPLVTGTAVTTSTVRTGPFGGTRAATTTVCNGDQCFTVPAGVTYQTGEPGVNYTIPGYTYTVPSGYGYTSSASGGNCGVGFSVGYSAGGYSTGDRYTTGASYTGWYPGKFLGRPVPARFGGGGAGCSW